MDYKNDIMWLEKYIMAELRTLQTRVETQIAASETALRIADKEGKRRDDELNHAHARALEAQNRTVPRDLYEANREDESMRREELAKQLQVTKDGITTNLTALKEEVIADIQFRAGEAKNKAIITAALLSAGITLIGIVISWFIQGVTL